MVIRAFCAAVLACGCYLPPGVSAQGFGEDNALELWMLDPRVVSEEELSSALAEISSTTLHAGASDVQGVTGEVTFDIINAGCPASGGLLPGIDRTGQTIRLWTPNTITRIGGSGGAAYAESGCHLFHAGTNVSIDHWISTYGNESIFNWRINSVSSDATAVPMPQLTPQPTVRADATPPLHAVPGSTTNSIVIWMDSPTPTPASTWWVERILVNSTALPYPNTDFIAGPNVVLTVTGAQVEIAAQTGAAPGEQPTPLDLQAYATPPIHAMVENGDTVVVWMESTPTAAPSPTPTPTPTWIIRDIGNVTASITASAGNASVTLSVEVGTPRPAPTPQEFRSNGGLLLQGRPLNFVQGSSIVIEATDDGTNINVSISAAGIEGVTLPAPLPTRRVVVGSDIIPDELVIENGLGVSWSYDGTDRVVCVDLNTPTITPSPMPTPTMQATAVAVNTFGPLTNIGNVQDGLERVYTAAVFTPVPLGSNLDAYFVSDATGNALIVHVTAPFLKELQDANPNMAPSEGDVLGYCGGVWSASEFAVSPGGGGASILGGLLDVGLAPTPVAGDMLIYSGTGEWNVGSIVTIGAITATYSIDGTSRYICLEAPTPVLLADDDDSLVTIGGVDYSENAIVIGNPTPGAAPVSTPCLQFESRDGVREKNLVFHDTAGGADTGAFYQNNTASSGDLDLDVHYGFGLFLSRETADTGNDEGYHTFDVFHYDSGSGRDIQRIKAGKTLSFTGPVSIFPAPAPHSAPTPVNFGPQRFKLDVSELSLGTGDRLGQTPPATGDDYAVRVFDQLFVHHEENDGYALADRTVNYVRVANGHIEVLEGIAIPEIAPEYDPPNNTSFLYVSVGDATPSLIVQNAAGGIWGVSMSYIGQAP